MDCSTMNAKYYEIGCEMTILGTSVSPSAFLLLYISKRKEGNHGKWTCFSIAKKKKKTHVQYNVSTPLTENVIELLLCPTA